MSRVQLNEFQRGMIIGMSQSGKSVREISTATSFPKSTVLDTIKRYKKTVTTNTAKRSGRPTILNDRDKRSLNRIVKNNRQKSLFSITNIFSCNISSISSRTVQRELHAMGYYGRAAIRNPLISEKKSLNAIKLVQKEN